MTREQQAQVRVDPLSARTLHAYAERAERLAGSIKQCVDGGTTLYGIEATVIPLFRMLEQEVEWIRYSLLTAKENGGERDLPLSSNSYNTIIESTLRRDEE